MKLIRDGVKNLLKPLVRISLALAPQYVLEKAVSIRPALLPYIPENRKFVFRKYLGDISVNIDTVYKIEREMFTGSYEKETLYVINKYVKSGDTCFDIGANVGPVSFALAKKAGSDGRVFAFEPGGFLFQRLTDNIKLNPSYAEIIKAYKIGFSDKIETLTWNEDKDNRGNAGFLLQKPNQEEKIELITIDDFFQKNKIEKVGFIKIDVEGMEYEVVKGAMNTIKKHKPILYYETGFFEKGFWAERGRGEKVNLWIEEILKEIGYRIYKVENNTVTETQYPDLSYNTLAMAPGFSQEY
ncbi:MAG: FkbM family methyltransferase [Candidatus Omnitrophota bacterium]